MRPAISRGTRVKKLKGTTPLEVLREDQIDIAEYESVVGQYKVATGVEEKEENVSC